MATRRSSGMTRQEAGRKGAEARWGKSYSRKSTKSKSKSTRSSASRSSSKSPSRRSTTSRTTTSRTAKKTATKRGQKSSSRALGPEYFREIGRRSSNKPRREEREEWGNELRRAFRERNAQRPSRAASSRWDYEENPRKAANRQNRWGFEEEEIFINQRNRPEYERAGRGSRWGR